MSKNSESSAQTRTYQIGLLLSPRVFGNCISGPVSIATSNANDGKPLNQIQIKYVFYRLLAHSVRSCFERGVSRTGRGGDYRDDCHDTEFQQLN